MLGFVVGSVITGISAIIGIKAYHKYVHEPEPWKPHEVSWRDIDDMELLEMHLDDEWFRKDYNISDDEYEMLKARFSNEETEEVPE